MLRCKQCGKQFTTAPTIKTHFCCPRCAAAYSRQLTYKRYIAIAINKMSTKEVSYYA